MSDFTRKLQEQKKILDAGKEARTIALTNKENLLKQKAGLEKESLALKVKPENLDTEIVELETTIKGNTDKIDLIIAEFKKVIAEVS